MNERLLDAPHDATELIMDALNGFIRHPSLHMLAQEFGFRHDPAEDYLQALHGFATTKWDYRAGRERNTTPYPLFDPDKARFITDHINSLPLMQARAPQCQHYNIGVAFGCMGETAKNRIAQLLEAYRSDVDFGRLVLLGSRRPVSERERHKLGLAASVTTEFDLMNAALESLCTMGGMELAEEEMPPDVNSAGPLIKTYKLDGTTMVQSVAPGVLPRRANTRDTLTCLRTVLGDQLHPGTTMLGVTSGPSIIYQHFLALEEITIPCGTSVEMIGSDELHSPGYLLNEAIKAGLDHALSAYTALKVRLEEAVGPQSSLGYSGDITM